MRLGFIGAGNMARALARGIGEPIVVADKERARAEALAAEVGGQAVRSNEEVVSASDAIVLCHKPGQLGEVAAELNGRPSAVVSILAGVRVADVEAAYPETPVYRFLPNIPVEVRQGVLCYARGRLADDGPEAELLDMFGRLGTLVLVDEPLIEPAMALMSCGPAFFALVVEALADAGVRQGLEHDQALTLAVETMAGSAAVLRHTGGDTRALRRRVTSPGGTTAAGLAALERAGVRAAFDAAVAAVVERVRR